MAAELKSASYDVKVNFRADVQQWLRKQLEVRMELLWWCILWFYDGDDSEEGQGRMFLRCGQLMMRYF